MGAHPAASVAAALLSFVTIPLSGHISDRIGRRRMYLIGAAVTGVFGFVYFALLDTMAPAAIFIAIVLSLIPHDMQYGPQAALIAVYIAFCAVVSLAATAFMPDYTGKDISREYDASA